MPYAVEFISQGKVRFFGSSGISAPDLRLLTSFFFRKQDAEAAMNTHYMVQNGSWTPIRVVGMPRPYGKVIDIEYVLQIDEYMFRGKEPNSVSYSPKYVKDKFSSKSAAKLAAREFGHKVIVVKTVTSVLE
jgi:hypothetical protein